MTAVHHQSPSPERAHHDDAIVPRHQLRVLVPLWVTATLLADAACLAAFARTPYRFDLLMATLLALPFSQTSLAAIWTGLGAGRFLLRMIVTIAVGVGWLGLLSLVGPSATIEFLAMIGLQIVCVSGPLLLARALGIRLMRGDQIPLEHRPLQFGIAHIMACTTVIAVLLSLGRVVPWPTGFAARELMLGPIFATVALLAVWAALGTGHAWVRLLVALIASPLLGLGACAMLTSPPAPQQYPLQFAVMTGLQGVLLAGSLWIFRLGGYRLMRKSSLPPQPQ